MAAFLALGEGLEYERRAQYADARRAYEQALEDDDRFVLAQAALVSLPAGEHDGGSRGAYTRGDSEAGHDGDTADPTDLGESAGVWDPIDLESLLEEILDTVTPEPSGDEGGSEPNAPAPIPAIPRPPDPPRSGR